MEFEVNNKNSTIISKNRICIPHYFVIKYKTDKIKKYYIDLVTKLIKEHELTNFNIEEKKAYIDNKIKYNNHVLTTDENISYGKLNKIFLEYFDN